MQQQKPKSLQQEAKETFNILHLVAHSHALAILVFFRRGFGTNALGAGIGTLLLMLVYGAFANCPEMFDATAVWLVVLIYRRATSSREEHSYFQGYSVFDRFMSDAAARKIVEPIAALLIGWGLMQVSENLGLFYLAEYLSLVFLITIEDEYRRRQKQQIKDAMIEMQYQADLMDELRK